ncbi:hypothetical protein BC834DRAFT_845064 [Gloeopeniophorella convolvens]|nr:hypothetical protein BC834DRAFT_845064 [Gloeopeniophorella convolvens]
MPYTTRSAMNAGVSRRNDELRVPITIDKIPVSILLAIFRSYRLATLTFPGEYWPWFTLIHVCRKWRKTVLGSLRPLKSKLRCGHGSPVPAVVRCSPSIPLVLDYQPDDCDPDAGTGWNPASFDGVLEALAHSDRITSLSIAAPGEVLTDLYEWMGEPAPLLEVLRLKCLPGEANSLTSCFGDVVPHLHVVHLTDIFFPLPPTPSISEFNLQITNAGKISLSGLLQSLCSMPQLKRLSLTGFHHLPSIAPEWKLPQPIQEADPLPSLSTPVFSGLGAHLEALFSRVTVPALKSLQVTLWNPLIVAIPFTSRVINTTNGLRSYTAQLVLLEGFAHVETSISLGNRVKLTLEARGPDLELQVASTSAVFSSLAPMMSTITILNVGFNQASSSPDDCEHVSDTVVWYAPLAAFSDVTTLRVASDFAVEISEIARDLWNVITLLPRMRKLQLLFHTKDGFNPSETLDQFRLFLTCDTDGHPVNGYCTVFTRKKWPLDLKRLGFRL